MTMTENAINKLVPFIYMSKGWQHYHINHFNKTKKHYVICNKGLQNDIYIQFTNNISKLFILGSPSKIIKTYHQRYTQLLAL